MEQEKILIEQQEAEKTSGTSWYEINFLINNKNVYVSVWFSYDREIGETDFGFEILEDSDNLTDEERESIKEFITERKFNISNLD